MRAVVERYDGDGVDDMPGLRVPVRAWQVDNEPDALASGSWEDYARLQEITYRAIKEAFPEAKVLMGGQTGPVESGRTALGIQTFDRSAAGPTFNRRARGGEESTGLPRAGRRRCRARPRGAAAGATRGAGTAWRSGPRMPDPGWSSAGPT